MEIEKLDVKNIFEIQRIRTLLADHPDLLSIFEILVRMSNNQINIDAKKIDNTEPVIEEDIDIDNELESDSDSDSDPDNPKD